MSEETVVAENKSRKKPSKNKRQAQALHNSPYFF